MAAIFHPAGFGGSLGAELAIVSPVHTTGACWFVHSSTGSDAVSPAGKSREAPLATLGQAQTNAAAGDVIVLLSGHTETLAVKITLSKAGLVILGEGQGSNQPSFARSADVNTIDVTGAAIRLENIRFLTDTTAGFTADRVLISANGVILRGCYFAGSATDSVAPMLAVANAVTNLTIDGGSYFVASGTSKTATTFRALAFNGTATDVEIRDVTVSGDASYGWLSTAISSAGAITRLRAKDVDLLYGSDVVFAANTVGYLHVRAESGHPRIEWP